MNKIDSLLYDYLQPWLGLPSGRFIEIHQDFTRLQKPYASWQLLSSPQVGEVVLSDIDEDGCQQLGTNRTLTVQVNFYGDEACDLCDAFIMRLHADVALELGDELDLGLLGIVQPVDTSVYTGDTWERRYSVRVTLSSVIKATQYVNLIESVVIEGELDNSPDTLIVEVDAPYYEEP
jgi:hypothetical protein